jgi:isopenicillin N synthase-like dioxygenase
VTDLFTKPPLEKKLEYSAQFVGAINQGYFPIGEATDIHPDLVERWVFCRRAFDVNQDPGFFVEDFWPIPEAEQFFRRLCLETATLINPLTESLFRYLGVDPHLYDERLTHTNFGLHLNYYPPISATDDASGAERLLGHEDIDLFTLLPAPRVEGLQVLNRKNGKWVRVTAPPGSIIMNTGEYMQRVTNDILPAATHRVNKPRDASHHEKTRVSIPFNAYLWENEVLEVLPGIPDPKYPPIKAMVFHTNATARDGEGR